LSGGASRLPGIFDVAESVLRRAVRLSWPMPLAKMPATLAEPEFATVLGMVNYGQRARVARGLQEDRWGTRLKRCDTCKPPTSSATERYSLSKPTPNSKVWKTNLPTAICSPA